MTVDWRRHATQRAAESFGPGIFRLDLKSPFEGAGIYYVEETASTMDEIRRLADNGAAEGSAIVTEFQQAGRGRGGGKSWQAPRGSSLLFSYWLGPRLLPLPASTLPLRTAIGVSAALARSLSIETRVKWPNDILCGGRKLCGILCETKGERSYVGIGMNCNQEGFPDELAARATSLRLCSGAPVELPLLLEALLQDIRKAYAAVDWQREMEELLYGRGAVVTVRNPLEREGHAGARAERIVGRVAGVGEAGELLLVDEQGRIHALVGGDQGLP